MATKKNTSAKCNKIGTIVIFCSQIFFSSNIAHKTCPQNTNTSMVTLWCMLVHMHFDLLEISLKHFWCKFHILTWFLYSIFRVTFHSHSLKWPKASFPADFFDRCLLKNLPCHKPHSEFPMRIRFWERNSKFQISTTLPVETGPKVIDPNKSPARYWAGRYSCLNFQESTLVRMRKSHTFLGSRLLRLLYMRTRAVAW